MEHQFRYYLPGIVFLVPIYAVVSWITINHYSDSDIRVFVLVGGITTLPLFAIPVGWGLYNIYRVYWLHLTKGGYENKDFEKIVRQDTIPFYLSNEKKILVNFSHIDRVRSWLKMDIDIFRKTFAPFYSKKKFYTKLKKEGPKIGYSEAITDYILFQDDSYDYARSVSSVRYALESSLFALFVSVPFTVSIWNIWNSILTKNFDNKFYFYTAFICIILLIFFITLYKRWKSADKEYDARLIFTVILSLKKNYFNMESIKKNIPENILKSIENIPFKENRYAAFDLDDTLLINDIGEAVFALLVKKKIINNFGWQDYIDLIKVDREKAYFKVIEIMNYLQLKTLEDTTKEIINSKDDYLELEGYKIPLPKPNPVMQSIIALLYSLDIKVNVITASNRISAEIVCWEYFGIPSNNVYGAKIDIDKKNRLVIKDNEIPYGKKKVDVLKKEFKDKPVVSGGDGIWDRFLLDYTLTEGVRLWTGNSEEYKMLKEKYFKNEHFFNLSKSQTK